MHLLCPQRPGVDKVTASVNFDEVQTVSAQNDEHSGIATVYQELNPDTRDKAPVNVYEGLRRDSQQQILEPDQPVYANLGKVRKLFQRYQSEPV